MSRLATLACSPVFAALGVALLGCTAGDDVYIDSRSSQRSTVVCCTEFKVGADLSGADFGVDASIKGPFGVLAQASSDIEAAATAMLDDVTNACRGIAQDLGADDVKQRAADAETKPSRRASLWCQLAVAQLSLAGASSATLVIEAPRLTCETSVDAKTKCQAKCDVSGTCRPSKGSPADGATPPTCRSGTLEVECAGSCEAEVKGGSIDCRGSCDVAVSGTCTALGGVECKGRCEGACEGSTDAGGNCLGRCKGTCAATAPMAACKGAFNGTCAGTCAPTGSSAKVVCSGKCAGEEKPLKCRGGTIAGGCSVDPKCDANCEVSAVAKASCDVQPSRIVAKGPADANLEAAIATLKVNLPTLILVVKARGEAFAGILPQLTLDLVADPSNFGPKATACALAVASAFGTGLESAKASIDAGLPITGQLGL